MDDKYKKHYASMTDNDALFHMVINECYDYSDGDGLSEIDSLEQLLSLINWSHANKLYNRDMYKVAGFNSNLVETLIDWVLSQSMNSYNRMYWGI